MKTYLVGGAVRDRLLGLEVAERDWVVVGSTPEAMIAAGYRPVGRDFPVFLHPESREEYALARTERKQGRGYHGFVFHTGADVTLEDDLCRRDLSINAIAMDENGRLIDPHGGQSDLDARLLRHVSPAFAEDPVRILRVARFHARFHGLGFRVAEDTLDLMRSMVSSGEVDTLVPERVWQETSRALMGQTPWVFFDTLRACGALQRLFPELDELHGVPQTAKYHPEIDTAVHVAMAVDLSAQESASLEVRYAVLCHDLGKATTPSEQLPSHRQHEQRGVPLVRRLSERYKVPNACRELAVIVAREHLNAHRAPELRAETLLKLLDRLDAFRQPQRFEQFLEACAYDARGRLGMTDIVYESGEYLRQAQRCAAGVRGRDFADAGLEGKAIAVAMRERRTQLLADFVARQRQNAADAQ